MKISVSSYGFTKQGKSFFEALTLAKSLGFDGIEFVDLPDIDTAKQLKKESERIGIAINCYCAGADFLQKDVQEEIVRLRGQVEIAKVLGCKMMRHDASEGYATEDAKTKCFEQALPVLAAGCRAVTEYAAEQGIATMVENHGFFCQDSGRIARLVGAVGHTNFGALVDIGNFACADEDPAVAVGNLAPMARHVHAKDFHAKPGTDDDPGEGWFRSRGGNFLRGSILGHGNIPVRQCLETLKCAGYGGWVTLEFEGIEDCVPALRMGKANLEAMLAKI